MAASNRRHHFFRHGIRTASLSNTSSGKAVTEDVESFPPALSLSLFHIDCPRLAIASGWSNQEAIHERNDFRAGSARIEDARRGAAARRRHPELRAGRFRYG